MKKPILPEDRDSAYFMVAALREAGDILSAAIAASPLPQARHVGAQILRRGDMLRIDRAASRQIAVLKEISAIFDATLPPDCDERPASVAQVEHFMAEIERLAKQHRLAGMASALNGCDAATVAALGGEVRHLNQTEQALAAQIDVADPAERTRIVREADAAATFLNRVLGFDTMLEAKAWLADLDRTIPGLRQSLARAATALAAFGLAGAAIADVPGLCAAMACLSEAGAEARQHLKLIRSEEAGLIRSAADKADKIVATIRLLDTRLGSTWHHEPISRLDQAIEILRTPNDRRQQKVIDYLDGLGITGAHERVLSAIVSSRHEIREFEADRRLQDILPGVFEGIRTDFTSIKQAITLRRDLLDALDGAEAGPAFLAAAEADADTLAAQLPILEPMLDLIAQVRLPEKSPLAEAVSICDDQRQRVADAIRAIETLPVSEGEPGIIRALDAGRLLRECEGVRTRICASPAYSAANAYAPKEILDTLQWMAALRAILPPPFTPESDGELAQLLVSATRCREQFASFRDSRAELVGYLGDDIVPSPHADLADYLDTLRQIGGLEAVVEAKISVIEAMEAAGQAGLGSFLKAVGDKGSPIADWQSELEASYATLDFITENDRFADAVEAAASEAAAASIGTDLPNEKGASGGAPSKWSEEVVMV